MAPATVTIHPLDLGTLVNMDKSVFTARHNQGVLMDVPCLGYLVLGDSKTIVVDTGPCDVEWAARYHRALTKTPEQEVPGALAKFGVKPEDVDIVILTHLHWDHCFNLEHFPNATFLVQREELAYAAAPLPLDSIPYEAYVPGIRPPWMEVFGRISPVDGDADVTGNVSVIALPGHTPGFQGVVVETSEGPWVIVGDTVPLYENWRREGNAPKIPGGIYQNLFDYQDTLERLRQFGDRILPGHDPEVLKHSRYPVS